MRNLVVFAHPRVESFNRELLRTYCAAAQERGHELRVRDLYAMQFNPILAESEMNAARGQGTQSADIVIEQQHVQWAEVVTLISPVWWIGWPAILKGWIDRIFAFNFAYGYGPSGTIGLLKGKSAIVFSTTGSNSVHWNDSGKLESVRISQDVGTLELSGIKVLEHMTFSPVGRLTKPETFAEYLQQARELVERRL